MPQIPMANESQVLNPGSPVPVGSSEAARIEGESVSMLGKAMFALGDALDTAGRQQRERQRKLDLSSALAAHAEQNVLAKIATEAERPAAEDSTGRGGVDRYKERMKSVKDTILENIYDPAVAQEFKAKATEHEVQTSLDVWSSELKKIDNRTSEKANQIVGSLEAMVRADPRTLDKAIVELDNAFVDVPGISAAAAQEASIKGRRQLVQGTVDTLAEAGHFATAKKLLDSKYSTVFSQDELHDKKKQLMETEQGITRWGWAKEDRGRSEREREHKENSNKLGISYVAQLESAKTQWEKDVILNNARSDMGRGLMDDTDYNVVQKLTEAETNKDDTVGMMYLLDSFDKGAPIDDIQERAKFLVQEGDISAKSGTDIWKYFENLKQRQRTDPIRMRELSEALSYAKSQLKPKTMSDEIRLRSGLLPEDDTQRKQYVETAKQIFRSADRPLDVVDRAIPRNMGIEIPLVIPGIPLKATDTEAEIKFKVNQFLDKPQNKGNKQLELETLQKAKQLIDQRKRKEEEAKKFREFKEQTRSPRQ